MQTQIVQDTLLGKLSKPLLALLAVMGGLTVIMYFQRFVGMAQTWRADDNYSHGFFIPLLAAYFVWDKWDRLLKTPVMRPPWAVMAGAGIIILSMLAHLVGVVGTEPRLSDLSFIGCLYGLVLVFLGPRVFRELAFPIFFLALMIPPPENFYKMITVPMQNFASLVSAMILNAVDIHVTQDGNMLRFTADKQLEVAQACSGIRSLLGLIAMSFTLSYLMLKRWPTKLILIALAPPVAIVCNVFRVTFTGFAYRKISEKFAEGFLHLFTGWAIFILALGIMLVILKVLVIIFEMEFDEDKPKKGPLLPGETGPAKT